MAIGGLLKAGVKTENALVNVASVKGTWKQINDNLEAAQTATEQLQPHTIALSTFHWCEVPAGATRILYRAKQDAAATTDTTSPIVKIWGAWGKCAEDGSFSSDPTAATGARFMRLDAATVGAAGVPLTLTPTGLTEDSSFEYSDPADLTGVDLKGANYVGMLVSTAAAVTGGAANGVYGEILFIN